MSQQRFATVSVRTPEGVAFSFRVASPAIRLAALLVDWATISAAWSVLGGLIRVFALFSPDVTQLVIIVAYFVLSQGYHMAFEWKWRGRTLGKKLLALRVVDAAGKRLTFEQVALRNLLRFVDVLPGAYLVGGAAALASRRGQRLGDLAAGTIVIWEPVQAAPDAALLADEKYNSLRGQLPVVARLRQSVSPEVAGIACEALARRRELEPGARLQLFAALAAHFRATTRIPEELAEGLSDEQLVRNVVEVLYLSRGRGPA